MASFLKDVFQIGVSKILMIICGLGTSVISARYLGPENNGIIAALLVYPSLFMSIGSLGIRQSSTYFLGREIYSEDQIKSSIANIWILTSILSLVVCYFLITYIIQLWFFKAL